jgi:hypothetical protein
MFSSEGQNVIGSQVVEWGWNFYYMVCSVPEVNSLVLAQVVKLAGSFAIEYVLF